MTATIDLLDPDLFAENRFHPVLARLRHESPVHWHPPARGENGFWVLTRYDDIVAAYRDAGSFGSRYGMHLGGHDDAITAVSQRMLIVSDPPDHTQLKRVFSGFFTAAATDRLSGLVHRVVHDIVSGALHRRETEFIEIAKRVPNHVICAMMDLPRGDWDWAGDVTTTAFEGETERLRSAAHSEIFLYLHDILARRRERPGDDLISAIAGAERDSAAGPRPLTDDEIVFNANGILAGANETTRYTAAGALLALASDGEQWARLRADPEGLAETAAEEALRWTSPGVHALRTVLRPVTIRGVDMAEGDRVTLWNASANRDEAVFGQAGRFLIDRRPNRHIAFGSGAHLCLGARLARLELRALLAELARSVETLRPCGEPIYNASNFTWGLRSLPLELTPANASRSVPAN